MIDYTCLDVCMEIAILLPWSIFFFFLKLLNLLCWSWCVDEELGEDIVDFGKKHIYKRCSIP